MHKLWGAIERLASPGHGDYDAVVRRCSFLWTDVDFAVQTLEHLREYRNDYVHAGRESSQAKTYCFLLQQHFRALIHWHIANVGRFKNLQEANSYLDLPPDLAVLRSRKKTIEKAIKFRSS